MHPDDLEWSDYSIAMRNKKYKDLINKLRNSKDEFKGTALEQINGIIDTFISIFHETQVGANDIDNFIKYPLSLATEAITKVIENNKVNIVDINKVFSINNSYSAEALKYKYLEQLKSFSLNMIDLKRLEANHNIINNRFHLDQFILNERHARYSASRMGFPIYCFLSICEKLDTYNLELPEKINLMVEEITYLINNVAHPKLGDESDINWHNNNDLIIPTVLTYIFGVYDNEHIPTEVKTKVLEAAYNKLNNSYYISNTVNKFSMNSNYLTSVKNIIDNNPPKTLFETILNYQVSGKINNKQEFIDLIINKAPLLWELDFELLFMIIYYYGVFTNKFESMNISVSKLLMCWFNNYIKTKSADKFNPSELISKFSKIIKCINNTDIMVDNGHKTRALKMVKSLSEVIGHISNVAYVDSITSRMDYSRPKYDKEDFNGYLVPGETSDYDKKILSGFKVLNDIENKLESLDTNAFIDLALNKEVVLEAGHEYVQSLRELILEHIELFDTNYLSDSLRKTKKEISESLSVHPTSEAYNVSNSISTFIMVVDNYKLFFESEEIKNITNKVKSDIQLEEYGTDDNLSNTLSEISKNTSSVANLVYMMNDVLSVTSVQEMKLSSYATMVIDKVKKGIQYIDDKQKEAFVTIDRIADSVDHWDDKEEKADARIQVVKGKMLPSLSKCIKAILTAGALSFVSIYLGILYLVIKYVSSKNAVAQERQAVCDELEVEVQMIDRKIQEAVDDKNFKEERKLRLLKKKILTHFAKISYDNATKWNNSIIMKPEADNQGHKFGLREE